jgi:hypothetical protein
MITQPSASHARAPRLALSIPVAFALALSGCGTPVPAEKAAYVGQWLAPQMSLLITQSGSVVYKRVEGGVTKSIDGPLKAFHGDNFEVGIGPLTTTFVVSAPPHPAGDATKMTVDGVELTKASTQ